MSDLIDRQAAIEKYGNWYVEEGTEEGFISDMKHFLEMLPSADPERKKGKWIKTDEQEEWYGYIYECSVCGYRLIDANEKYCPNCGADMRGEE